MPTKPLTQPLSPAVKQILNESNGQLTTKQTDELVVAVHNGAATPQDLATITKRFGDLFTAGAAAPLERMGDAAGKPYVFAAPLRSVGDDPASAAVLRGDKALSATTHSRDQAVVLYQRALDALASRTGNKDFALVGGADGSFGPDTARAVSAFQTANELPVTGEIDRATAVAIEEQLSLNAPPDIGGVTQVSDLPDGDRIAEAAKNLVATSGPTYGVAAVWKSPNPHFPGNVNPGVTPLGAQDRWKCNLFGMDALFMGGAKPPTYPNGQYPIAVDIPNYYKGAHPPLLKLGEVQTAQFTDNPAELQNRVNELLRIARPGDLIMVKHPGAGGADGGHTRVVVANHFAEDQRVDTAEAGTDTAAVKTHDASSFTGEVAMYLLRPNQKQP